MTVKSYKCKLTLEINGKEVHGNFVTTRKEMREDTEMILKSVLLMAQNIK